MPASTLRHICYLGLGSNIPNRLQHIHNALAMLEARNDIEILQTSHLYESKPMYLTEQANFLNIVTTIATSLKPLELLRAVKAIELSLGRRKSVDNGPRQIDLDLLAYGDKIVADQEHDLYIPHTRIREREFVLRPFSDIAPDFILPDSKQSVKALLNSLPAPSQLSRLTATSCLRNFE